jgi:hypothetical protein
MANPLVGPETSPFTVSVFTGLGPFSGPSNPEGGGNPLVSGNYAAENGTDLYAAENGTDIYVTET